MIENIEVLLKPLLEKNKKSVEEMIKNGFAVSIEQFLEMLDREYDEHRRFVNEMMNFPIDGELESIANEIQKETIEVSTYKYIINIYMCQLKECITDFSMLKVVIQDLVDLFKNVTYRIEMKKYSAIEFYEMYQGLVNVYKKIMDNVLLNIKNALFCFEKDFSDLNNAYNISHSVKSIKIPTVNSIEIITTKGIVVYKNDFDKAEKVMCDFLKKLCRATKIDIKHGDRIYKDSYVWEKCEIQNTIINYDDKYYENLGTIICLMYSLNCTTNSDYSKDIVYANGGPMLNNIYNIFANDKYSLKMDPVKKYILNSVDIFNIYKDVPVERISSVIQGFDRLYHWINDNKKEFIVLAKDCLEVLLKNNYVNINSIYLTSIHPFLLESYYVRKLYIYVSLYNIGINDNAHIIENILNYNDKVKYVSIENDELQKKEAAFEQKINEFSEKDLCMQKNIIRNKCGEVRRISFADSIYDCCKDDVCIDDLVCRTLDLIKEKSIIDNNEEIRWITTKMNGLAEYVTEEIDYGIYNGIAGILLTYYYGWEKYGKEEYYYISKKLCKKLCILVEQVSVIEHFKHGAFVGISGVLYVITKCENLLSQEYMIELIVKYLASLERMYTKLKEADYIVGLDGILCILDSIYQKKYNESLSLKLKELIKKIVDVIIEARKTNILLKYKVWDEEGYVGYAHGSAGTISALLRVNKYLNDERIDNVVNEILQYDNEMYSNTEKNWFRSHKQRYCMCAWCHGAGGMLLNRIGMIKNGYDTETIRSDALNAMNTLMKNELGRDACLCHGDLGNLIILKEAALLLNNTKILKYVNETFYNILVKQINEELKEGGVIEQFEECGLMCGIASIAYGIMKLENDQIPNILELE